MATFTRNAQCGIICIMSSPERVSLGEWLAEGPYTLALSSGFFGFYAHAGVLEALCESDVAPAALRASSGGAVTAALWASGLEPAELSQGLSQVKREDFWDPAPGVGLLRGEVLDDTLRSRMPVTDFAGCRLPISISVFDVRKRETEVINSGDLVLATRASSAFPGLFQPVIINGQPKLDGGIKDHAGYYGAPLQERILHHDLKRKQVTVNRENLQRLSLEALPTVNPFKLYRGMVAYKEAYRQTIQKLSEPIMVMS